MRSGRSSPRSLMSIEVNPYTALVSCPLLVARSGGRAKNARKERLCPSRRKSRLGRSTSAFGAGSPATRSDCIGRHHCENGSPWPAPGLRGTRVRGSHNPTDPIGFIRVTRFDAFGCPDDRRQGEQRAVSTWKTVLL